MEIPDAVVTAVSAAGVTVAASLSAAVVALWRQGNGKDRALRDCEKKNRRALRLARYEVESLATGKPSVRPEPQLDEEPSIVRRVGLERDRRFFEDKAQRRAQTDGVLREYLDSERPPPAGPTKTRIRFR